MAYVLINSRLGIPTDRWFGLNVAVHGVTEAWFHCLNARLVAMMGRRFGPGIASPEYVDNGDVKKILEWVLEKSRRGQNCCIITVVSNAARIARVAVETGLCLQGTTFHASGEPLTEPKRKLVEKAGARIALHYGPGGGNGAALGCGNPRFIDEMHIPHNMFTLVEHPTPLDYSGAPIHPLMLTTLHSSASRLLLNVENGDYATMLARNCGCALQKVGFTQHIHTVRSFEKMTGEGMNFSGSDLFELLENTIPSEFGGGPGDYQLVEEEDDRGQTRLTLVVHPEVGNVNETEILSRLLQGLSQGSRNRQFISRIWQDAGTFRIRRDIPYASARGKVLPLRINR
jgi:phenylacetate-coenzyme A ligase PaaK-like adenylate-forming protein